MASDGGTHNNSNHSSNCCSKATAANNNNTATAHNPYKTVNRQEAGPVEPVGPFQFQSTTTTTTAAAATAAIVVVVGSNPTGPIQCNSMELEASINNTNSGNNNNDDDDGICCWRPTPATATAASQSFIAANNK